MLLKKIKKFLKIKIQSRKKKLRKQSTDEEKIYY